MKMMFIGTETLVTQLVYERSRMHAVGKPDNIDIDYIERRWKVAHPYNGCVSLYCDQNTGVDRHQLRFFLAH